MSRRAGEADRNGLEVAIIGMACRFPGAGDLATFWRNLRDGIRSVSTFTDEELIAAGVSPEIFRNPAYVRANAVLDHVDLFDAAFFDYSPREAEMMDPQHRIFLECCSQALADGGYDAAEYSFPVGVYAGANINTYFFNFYSANLTESSGDLQPLIGNDKDYLATRASYKLNLRGPSITVQTACSTSLVAVHLACRGLLSGECDMALAGGVSIRIPQKAGYLYQEGGVHSPDGFCRAFDARAQGTTFGSGAGVVLLKRLEQAIQDNDFIYAVIKGSAINNDGAVKVGYTAPSLEGQAAVIRAAYQVAEVSPETVTYVEAHATGTPLGDPVELAALSEVFSAKSQARQFCGVGSVKTNFGHLVTAAGIAGLIKTILALVHRQLPPSLNFEQPNPHIDFENSPFYVNTVLRDWPASYGTRRAGVSSFGVGGTNAHVVIEEAPPRGPGLPPVRRWQVLPLSARTSSSLKAATRELASALEQHTAEALPDIAYTLQVGRRAFPWRHSVVCRSLDEARKKLSADAEQVSTGVPVAKRRPVAFMFPGQGTQYLGMAGEIYETEPVFRAEFERCSRTLRARFGLDLQSVIYSGEPAGGLSAADRLNQTEFTQPALFVLEYALAKLWMSWGVVPHAMIGHSIGEYVAAAISGVFPLEDALTLIHARGRLIQSLKPGVMLAISLPEAEVQPLIVGEVGLAAINTPSSCVVAGPEAEMIALQERLKQGNIPFLQLRTSHAFHSPMMEPALLPFSEQLKHMRLHPPQLPFISNVTGTWITAEEATSPNYWVRHLRKTVLFAKGLTTLAQETDCVLLEVGVGHTLKNFAVKHPGRPLGQLVLASLPGENDDQDAEMVLLSSLGQLWVGGAAIDWEAFSSVEKRGRLSLPTYSFERKRYWAESSRSTMEDQEKKLGKTESLPVLAIPSWKRSLPPVQRQWAGTENVPKKWMVFTDSSAFSAEITSRLCSFHLDVVTVQPGDKFEVGGQQRYRINPRRKDDYIELFATLKAAGEMPEVIIHTWNAGQQSHLADQAEYQHQCLRLGFYSLLFLVEALGKQQYREQLDLVVVAANLHSLAGEVAVIPEVATLAAACNVIPLEYPHIHCRLLDIMPSSHRGAENSVVAQVLNECMFAGPDRLVVYRNQDRWIRTFEPVDVPPETDGNSRLRNEGVYLITGGTGEVGLLLAEYLVKKVRARLVLAGRTDLPSREQWDHYIRSGGASGNLRQKLIRIQQIELMGGSVMIARVDVADRARMEALMREIKDRYGALHGVFHLAGIAGGGLMQFTTEEQVESIFTPKVQGSRVLEEVLREHPLDFLMLFSSTLALTGAIGHIAYCAANAFLDAFAHYSAARKSYVTVSINWDGWRGTGMNAPPGSNGAGPEEVHHPLINVCLSAASGEADFLTTFQGDTDWMLSEHKISGIPTLPGSAILEMARAAFSHFVPGQAILMEDILFLAPLTVDPSSNMRVRTRFKKKGEHFEFRINADEVAGQNGNSGTEYARGRIARAASHPAKMDVSSILKRCPRQVSDSVEGKNDARQVVHWGEHWKNLQKVNLGENEAIAFQELPDRFSAELSSFCLHPALLDLATASLALASGMTDYIPLSYGRVTVYGPLTQRIYTYSKSRNTASATRTRVAFDVTILDFDGNVLVDIQDFVMIQESALDVQGMLAHQSGTSRPGAPRGRSAASTPFNDELPPEVAMAAFERILAMLPTTQIIVSAEDIRARIEKVQSMKLSGLVREGATQGDSEIVYPRPSLQTDYVPPGTDLEKKVADIWQQVLAIEKIGLNDNFFDLGGHSLLAIQIVDRLRQTFGIEVPLSKVIESHTISNIAAYIDNVKRESEEREQRNILERIALLSEEEAELELRRHAGQ